MLTGCEDDNEPHSLCYQGRGENLNQGNGCPNIIKIIKSDKDGKLLVDATISFNPELYDGEIKVGDDVYFKVVAYENYDIIMTANCSVPQYAAIIEFCK